MADHQRVHPVTRDVEAPQEPTVPLVPQATSKSSENGDPTALEAAGPAYPPAPQHAFPMAHSRPPKKRRSCFCRCICWTLSLLLLIIFLLGILVGVFFLVFHPKLPKYSIDKMDITQFTLSDNSSLQATFNVTITARNPNKKIGIYYVGGSHIRVLYNGTKIGDGALPKFYQGHRNTTVLSIPMTGQAANASGLIAEVEKQEQETGSVPLRVRVKQPVRIKVGKLKLMKLTFRVRCNLEVNDLSANTAISVKNSSCKFRFKL